VSVNIVYHIPLTKISTGGSISGKIDENKKDAGYKFMLPKKRFGQIRACMRCLFLKGGISGKSDKHKK
jgi:hypothetical protein